MSLPPGTIVDRYTIEDLLGTGGMANVYRARHNQLGTLHAIKVLFVSSRLIRERLLQEGRAQASLRHPNLVSVTDIIEVDGEPGLVMEFVDGPSLAQLLGQMRLSLEQVDAIALGIIAGVAEASRHGIVHRDLKPGNVMLQATPRGLVPKITDFGLAKMLDEEMKGAWRTRSGVLMGTPCYMAPEQISEAKGVDARADIFSLGAILYEMVTGQLAFTGPNVGDILQAVCAGNHISPRVFAPDLPDRMADAIDGALEVDRERRIQDCDALLRRWTGRSALTEPKGPPHTLPQTLDAPGPSRSADLVDPIGHGPSPTLDPSSGEGGVSSPCPSTLEEGPSVLRPAHVTRQFQFRHCLGAGGFGEVYLAAMTSASGVRMEIAVKVLHESLNPRSQSVQRLRDEAHLLAALNHPAIVRVTDLVLLDNRIALVTEYIEGADLDTCLQEAPPLPRRAQLEVIGRIAEALQAAWSTHSTDGRQLLLVHRDVKPANIRISRHGDVKLLDFGIARSAVDGARREAHTQTHAIIGTLPYMAPERFDDQRPCEPSGDVFSLGATLFEGIAGARLFEGVSMHAHYELALTRSRHEAFLSSRLATLPPCEPALLDLMRQMLSFDPRDRPEPSVVAHACEAISETLAKPTLRQWCRDRDWPAPKYIEGNLCGRTITETLPAQPPSNASPADIDGATRKIATSAGPRVLAPTDSPVPTPTSPAPQTAPRSRPWRTVGAIAVAATALGLLAWTWGVGFFETTAVDANDQSLGEPILQDLPTEPQPTAPQGSTAESPPKTPPPAPSAGTSSPSPASTAPPGPAATLPRPASTPTSASVPSTTVITLVPATAPPPSPAAGSSEKAAAPASSEPAQVKIAGDAQQVWLVGGGKQRAGGGEYAAGFYRVLVSYHGEAPVLAYNLSLASAERVTITCVAAQGCQTTR